MKTLSQERMEHCNSCEYKIGLPNVPICKKCGCFLSLKTRLKSQSCPIGKWEAVGGSDDTKGCRSCS